MTMMMATVVFHPKLHILYNARSLGSRHNDRINPATCKIRVYNRHDARHKTKPRFTIRSTQLSCSSTEALTENYDINNIIIQIQHPVLHWSQWSKNIGGLKTAAAFLLLLLMVGICTKRTIGRFPCDEQRGRRECAPNAVVFALCCDWRVCYAYVGFLVWCNDIICCTHNRPGDWGPPRGWHCVHIYVYTD